MSSSLLTPDPGLIFWMIIAFGLVLLILSKFGFPVILDKLDSRKKYIDESLVAAKQAYDKLEHVQERKKILIQSAKKEQFLKEKRLTAAATTKQAVNLK